MNWSGRYCLQSSDHINIETHTRLAPVRCLGENRIPCIIWGEDMLENVYHVPTVLFHLHLLVADQDIPRAISCIIESGLPYLPFSSVSATEAYPEAIMLQGKDGFRDWVPASHDPFFEARNLPTHIILHPASSFHFDITDPSRSFTPCLPFLPESNRENRYPTLPAVLESIFSTWITPLPEGKTRGRYWFPMMRVWSGYIREYSRDEPCFPEEQEDVEPEYIILNESARKLVLSVREDMRGMAERLVRKDAWSDEGSGEKPGLSEAWYRQFGRSDSKSGIVNLSKRTTSTNWRSFALRQVHTISCHTTTSNSTGDPSSRNVVYSFARNSS